MKELYISANPIASRCGALRRIAEFLRTCRRPNSALFRTESWWRAGLLPPRRYFDTSTTQDALPLRIELRETLPSRPPRPCRDIRTWPASRPLNSVVGAAFGVGAVPTGTDAAVAVASTRSDHLRPVRQ